MTYIAGLVCLTMLQASAIPNERVRIAWKPVPGQVLEYRAAHGMWITTTSTVFMEHEVSFSLRTEQVGKSGIRTTSQVQRYASRFGCPWTESTNPNGFLAEMLGSANYDLHGVVKSGHPATAILYNLPLRDRGFAGFVYPAEPVWTGESWAVEHSRATGSNRPEKSLTSFTLEKREKLGAEDCWRIRFRSLLVDYHSREICGTYWVNTQSGAIEKLTAGKQGSRDGKAGTEDSWKEDEGYVILERVG